MRGFDFDVGIREVHGPDSLRQEAVDTFYMWKGHCCAGCDHWRSYSSTIGECTRSAPVSSAERLAAIGITRCSLAPAAGHVLTLRDHVCGEFADTFDWTTLPLPYRRRIRDRSLSSGRTLADAHSKIPPEAEHG